MCIGYVDYTQEQWDAQRAWMAERDAAAQAAEEALQDSVRTEIEGVRSGLESVKDTGRLADLVEEDEDNEEASRELMRL